MDRPLSRRDFSRRAAVAGLSLGVAGLVPGEAFADQSANGDHPERAAVSGGEAHRSVTMQEGRLAAAEFPLQRDGVYLNHAASSPLPQRTSVALRHYLDDRQRLFHLYQTGTQEYDVPPLQARVGRLLNFPVESVRFAASTTVAISWVHWITGHRIDVARLATPCTKGRGASRSLRRMVERSIASARTRRSDSPTSSRSQGALVRTAFS